MQQPSLHVPSSNMINALSGAVIDYRNPQNSVFTLEDIAAGLSNECRFAGQLDKFYSVAQHSILVLALAPRELAIHALMHDASEAFMKDIPKPLKNMLPDYEKIEEDLSSAIMDHFKINMIGSEMIHFYDQEALEIEFDAFRKNKPMRFEQKMRSLNYLPGRWTPEMAKYNWLYQIKLLIKK